MTRLLPRGGHRMGLGLALVACLLACRSPLDPSGEHAKVQAPGPVESHDGLALQASSDWLSQVQRGIRAHRYIFTEEGEALAAFNRRQGFTARLEADGSVRIGATETEAAGPLRSARAKHWGLC